MNKLYRSLVVEKVKFALASARAAGTLEHAGVKGAIREVLIADLFKPLLPADIGIATGIIISSFDDKQSAQQDIVIFDQRVLPLLFFRHGLAIIPVEAALATVEVKSCLSATELQNAHANALTIKELDLQSGIRNSEGVWVDVPTPWPVSLLFALESDLSPDGKTEVDRYKKIYGNEPPVLRGICIPGKGSWWPQERPIFDKPSGRYLLPNSEPFQDEWYEVIADGEHQEVLKLLAGLHSLVLRVTPQRGQPPLDGYLC